MVGQDVLREGAAYERFMGSWSALAGEAFLDWLKPPSGLRWIDVGCGGGAFTQVLIERSSPAEVQGIDPSRAQLAFARARPAARLAQFSEGTAMNLAFSDHRFDAAVMALVIFFVPDPSRAVAEMARVVRPGGIVTAYAWDMMGGGFPAELLREELKNMGIRVPTPASFSVSRMDVLLDLWASAGLCEIETQEITARRVFSDFDDYWTTNFLAASLRPAISAMGPDEIEHLKTRVKQRLDPDAADRITCTARANAITGRLPI